MFFGWGEIFSLFPSTLTDTFGAGNATTNYGFLYMAQGIGSALYEEVVVDPESGAVVNPVFRLYRMPQSADIPDTEVYFAATSDDLGPFGAKSMSESPFNPVAAAMANAIRRAVGVRPYETPMSRDRVWRMVRS